MLATFILATDHGRNISLISFHLVAFYAVLKFDLKKFVDKKYGVANINATHHYEDADKYQVDSTAPIADAITNFKHEETVNDAKRVIRIIQPRYIDLVVDEFKRLMATQ